MRRVRLESLLSDVLGEIIIDGISDFVVHLAFDRAIGAGYMLLIIRLDVEDLALLRLWMEHDSRDGVLFAFNCDYEFFSVQIIRGQDLEEVSQWLSLLISICLDDPVVCMVQQILHLHALKQLIREGIKHVVQAASDLIDMEIKRT